MIEEIDAELADQSARKLAELFREAKGAPQVAPQSAPQNRTTHSLHCEEPAKPEDEGPSGRGKSFNNSAFNSFILKYKRYRKRKHTLDLHDIHLDKTFTSETVPAEFLDEVGRYFNDAIQIETLWKRAEMIANTYGIERIDCDYVIQAFRATL